MQQKITLTEMEQMFPIDSSEKKMQNYPKAQTLNFIRQFAYAYHAEGKLPLSLATMILN